MMKAAVITEYGALLEIKQVPIPQPGPNDVLVKLIACGICHSDLHAACGDFHIKPPLPLILGHEGVGRIVEFGANVTPERYHLKLGDLIGIQFLQGTCLKCEFCLDGRETLCNTKVATGVTRSGAFAEYALMNADFAAKLPDGMDPFKAAPLYCAGVTMYKALKVSQARSNDWISIVGVGGSLGIKYAKAMGFRVIGIVAEKDQATTDLALEMGADEAIVTSPFLIQSLVYNGPGDQHSDFVKEKTNGGVQAAIVAVPLISAYEQALQSLKPGGCLVLVGIPAEKLSIAVNECIGKQIRIVGSLVGTRNDLQEALDMARKHNIECRVQTCQLEQINEVFDNMKNCRLTGRMAIDFTTNSK
ncbi:unnamed protein product [Rotaria sordida]|uniref:Enoyl reductase (ER) domain-containing protein n=1 Tax=Rotaria sordida TaxID=392033 RepID=A0A819IB92_9BILA|nr:unnamed protein product [Rotaria sordida]CAF4080546.1 unnamed protein product [Rotaria sordida]